MYYDRDTWFMTNLSVNEFYTRFLLKIDALPHNSVLTLDITATFLNNLSPDKIEVLTSESVQPPLKPPNETNHQENQSIVLVKMYQWKQKRIPE